MSVHTLQIVDSIATSPATRLDLNDGTIWKCTLFDAPPPRLRRAMSNNAMGDGAFVSSSQYEPRKIVARFQVFRSTRDLVAVQLQTLARELDRSDNYLKFQHDTATKPVFFKLFRSDMSAIRDIPGQSAAYECEVELLAQPFGTGTLETLGPYTVNQDPAAGSNGCFFDVTGVIGDVAAPCVMLNTSRLAGGVMSVRQHGVPADLVFFEQAESCTLGTDTTNPASGTDAAMSGAANSNFVRTSFATATMQTRITWDNSGQTAAQRKAARGTYRLYVIVRRSDGTSTMTARCINSTASGETVTIPASVNRQAVSLGTISFGGGRKRIGLADDTNPAELGGIAIQAARPSGAGTLDWDAVLLIPADERLLMWQSATTSAGFDTALDGHNEDVRYYDSGADIFAGTGDAQEPSLAASGGFPSLVPNQTNRFFHLGGVFTAGELTVPVTDSESWTLYYWPQYLYIRPAAS